MKKSITLIVIAMGILGFSKKTPLSTDWKEAEGYVTGCDLANIEINEKKL